MRRALNLAMAGLATLILLTSCNLVPRGCTEAGAESGVFFSDIIHAFPGPAPAVVPTDAADEPVYRVLACAAEVCEEWVGRSSEGPWLQVLLEDLTAPTSLTASLTLTDTATGEIVFDASTSVDLMVVQPNGPQCPPTAFQGYVAATPDGTLVQVAVPL